MATKMTLKHLMAVIDPDREIDGLILEICTRQEPTACYEYKIFDSIRTSSPLLEPFLDDEISFLEASGKNCFRLGLEVV